VFFSKRCGAFSQKIRCFCSKDAVLLFKRCGDFFIPVNTGLLKASKTTRLIQFPFELLRCTSRVILAIFIWICTAVKNGRLIALPKQIFTDSISLNKKTPQFLGTFFDINYVGKNYFKLADKYSLFICAI
jgi:hypothetical protein